MLTNVSKWLPLLVLFSLIAFSSSSVWAGEIDILLKKLVEQGVLTKQDADGITEEMRRETVRQEKKSQEEKKVEDEGMKPAGRDVDAPSRVTEIPEWIKNTRFIGDLRLRYQYDDREDDNLKERHRGRFRLRAGAEMKVADGVKAGFGLVTGTGDPRSTTITFENTFEKKSVRIDYAFAEYKPVDWLTLTGGKFNNPLWRPSDFMWDGDMTPEGAAVNLRRRIMPNLDIFLNTVFFILDKQSSGSDPNMTGIQPGMNWKFNEDVNLQLAMTYYLFGGVKGHTLEFSSNTNTRLNDQLRFDYDAPSVSAELGFKNPLGLTFIPYFGIFGEYIYNPDPDNNNQGYVAGARLKHNEMSRFGDWMLEYSYRRLEKDAWPDVFPDSDFHGGDTDVKGHEAIVNFALWKNIWLALDYYRSQRIVDLKQKENLFQFDFNVKF